MRPFAIVRTADQWQRCHHVGTSVEVLDAELRLAHEPLVAAPATQGERRVGGIAFDRVCRLYRIRDGVEIERSYWRPGVDAPPVVEDLFRPRPVPPGAFVPGERVVAPLRGAAALAIDDDNRLFVLERDESEVIVYDVEHDRLLRRVALGTSSPVDLASAGRLVWLLTETPGKWLTLSAWTGPVMVTASTHPRERTAKPAALALSPRGERFVLYDAGEPGAFIVSPDVAGWRTPLAVPYATEIALDGEGTLVVAQGTSEHFARYVIREGSASVTSPATAFGYDGRALGRAPTGHVGYWNGTRFLPSITARARFLREGTVVTFRLDAGEFQTRWGRLFLDACIPTGTSVRVKCFTTDEIPPNGSLLPSPPAGGNDDAHARSGRTPPQLPKDFEDDLSASDGWSLLHRRSDGRELPSVAPLPDAHATYEAHVMAPPGRYLWVAIRLDGNTRSTPRIRCLRAEHPGHALLQVLPRHFSRDESMAWTLQRFMAPTEGLLALLGDRADERHALIDPASAPEEFLPWLASFVGLALDARWGVAQRRALIAEAACLFRMRGTVWGLTRLLELCSGRQVFLLEDFKVRGLGGALGGEGAALTSRAVLGGGFRVGGNLADGVDVTLGDTLPTLTEKNAHRFTAVVVGTLTEEERSAFDDAVRVHKPAHTVHTLCVIDRAMRVGDGLHVGITSLVGQSARFAPAVLDRAVLDRGVVMGSPLCDSPRADAGGSV